MMSPEGHSVLTNKTSYLARNYFSTQSASGGRAASALRQKFSWIWERGIPVSHWNAESVLSINKVQ